MTLLNAILLILGVTYSLSNGAVQSQHDSQMSQSADDGAETRCGGCQDRPHKPHHGHHHHHHGHHHHHHKKPHRNNDRCCCEPVGCHDPCVLDPPEVFIDPMQGFSTDDPSLTILVGLSWPRKDVHWYLDAFWRLNITTTFTEFTDEEIEAINKFSEEAHLEDMMAVLEQDTTKEQSHALSVGEEELAKKDEMELAIREANITFAQNAPTLQHQLAFRRTDPIATRMARVGIITNGATLNFMDAFEMPSESSVAMVFIGPLIKCEDRHHDLLRPLMVECDDPNNPYRTQDGSCNNLIHTLWGASFTPYRRDLPADYFNGVFSFRRSVTGKKLPSARAVSVMINGLGNEKSPTFSILHMTFGQFVDHNLLATAPARASFSGYSMGNSPVKCCNVKILHRECAPIIIPQNDPFYSCFNQTCMEFVRSAPAGNCMQGPRDQINEQTSYLDASAVYGALSSTTDRLRTFVDGLLKGQVTQDGELLLPRDFSAADECNREERMAQDEFCFLAGDGRVNEQILLTFFQTLWAREHNRVVRILKECNDNWNDEMLFQEARRIIAAELQQLVYHEYLPTIISPTLMAALNLNTLEGKQMSTDYDDYINVAISSGFSTAAYRFGHSLVADNLLYINKQGQVTPNELSTLQFNPFDLYRRDGMCDAARGGIALPENKMDADFTIEIAGKLFRRDAPFGLDLVAFNIQRGRDHGLPSYNNWRELCGLPRAQNFHDLLPQMNHERIHALEQAYDDVNDIDLFVGGVSENPVSGAVVGHTFTCIIANQFLRIRRGDRYWFEYKNGPGAFTKGQIKQLHRVTLARIMCNNLPELEHVQRWPLMNLGPDNPKVCCKSIRQYSLDPWKNSYVEEEEEDDHEY